MRFCSYTCITKKIIIILIISKSYMVIRPITPDTIELSGGLLDRTWTNGVRLFFSEENLLGLCECLLYL